MSDREKELAEEGLHALRGNARAGKAEVSAVAIPLEGVPMKGWGIKDIYKDGNEET